jgi:hypothetical protein
MSATSFRFTFGSAGSGLGCGFVCGMGCLGFADIVRSYLRAT